jgi:hypothetical protein
MFDFLTAAIAFLVVGGMLWGVYRRNDTFHPLVYLLPMAGYLYVFVPSFLAEGELLRHFTGAEVARVQALNLAGVLALIMGVVVGGRGLRRDPNRRDVFSATLTPVVQARLRRVAVAIGLVGVGLFVYGLFNVGGFVAAFDSPKGGGWAATGWLRDLKLLVIPGILLLYLSRRGRGWTPADWGWLVLFSLPLLARSLLATSRGWTFMAAAALGAGWYLAHNRRPRFPTLLAGGAALGILMLTLVAFRGQIYIGSGFFSGDRPPLTEMVDRALEFPTGGGYGNEFIYGNYTVLLAQEEQDFYWGRRVFAYTVVRPIPSLVWPNKYADVGAAGIRYNAGTMGKEYSAPVYEHIPNGMAPGIVADLFVEFSWGAVPAVFLFGWLYGVGWRRHLVEGGPWTVVYLALMAFSVFAVLQNIPQAFVARFLIVVVPTLLLWWRMVPGRQGRAALLRRRSAALSAGG